MIVAFSSSATTKTTGPTSPAIVPSIWMNSRPRPFRAAASSFSHSSVAWICSVVPAYDTFGM